jgi:hypothetical protein
VVVVQTDVSPSRQLLTAARRASAVCVSVEWAVQCVLRRERADTQLYLLDQATPSVKPQPAKPTPPPALPPPPPPQPSSAARAARAAATPRARPAAAPSGSEAPPAEPAVVRCLDPYPQTDLFDDWRECVGCSDALQRVKVRCGCVTCDKPLPQVPAGRELLQAAPAGQPVRRNGAGCRRCL